MHIKAKKGAFSKETEDGLATLSKDEKRMFILNSTARSIWKMCSSKMSIDDVLLKLSEEYNIKDTGLEDLKKDCIAIVKQNPDLFEIICDQ